MDISRVHGKTALLSITFKAMMSVLIAGDSGAVLELLQCVLHATRAVDYEIGGHCELIYPDSQLCWELQERVSSFVLDLTSPLHVSRPRKKKRLCLGPVASQGPDEQLCFAPWDLADRDENQYRETEDYGQNELVRLSPSHPHDVCR